MPLTDDDRLRLAVELDRLLALDAAAPDPARAAEIARLRQLLELDVPWQERVWRRIEGE